MRERCALQPESLALGARFNSGRCEAYTGFVRRDSIARKADAEITSFEELATMVLG
jgi:hypothetical protein